MRVVVRRIAVLAGVCAVALTLAPADAVTTVTLRPSGITFTAPEVPNINRGQIAWQAQPAQPIGWPATDVYYRDQVYWGRLEPTRGTYNFAPIDAGLAEAGARHGKFSFRVMAWCPGCWMEGRPYGDPKPPATPQWMPRQPVALTAPAKYQQSPPPDWNNPAFLLAWQQLVAALGRKYDKDPRLGFIDIGGYGAYGEWNTDGFGAQIGPANAQKVIQAMLDAFPHHTLIINSMIPKYVVPALRMSPRIGVRVDCLGAGFFGWTFDAYADIRNRWKTAPVLSEWCHSGATIQQGLDQVTRYHVSQTSSGNAPWAYADMTSSQRAAWAMAAKKAGYRFQIASLALPSAWRRGVAATVTLRIANVGSAPTYDDWRVQLRLLRPDGSVAGYAPLPVNLRRALPGTSSFTASVAFNVPAGRYRVAVVVLDPARYAAPMRLATSGRDAHGNYPVGTVSVS